jgi:MFS family permease
MRAANVATQAQATPTGASTTTFGNLRHAALASFWFGQFFLWQPVGTVLVQHQVDDLVPRGDQGTALGLLIGCGGFIAMALPPLVGAWSDRLTTRFGRRRPIMVAGTLGTILGLLILFGAHSYLQLLLGYVVVQVFFNGAGAAYAGLIPDVVPEGEYGRASGFLATMVQLGSGAGLAVTAVITGPRYPAAYLVIAVVILLSVIPTALVTRGEGLRPIPRAPHVALARAVREFLRPLWTGDFGWVIATRLCTTAGINAVAYFLFNFFRDVVHVRDPATFTPEWFLVVLAVAIPFGLAAGALSDRLGRKPFVYASGALQSLVALVYIVLFPTNQALVFAIGAVYGAGYGCYYAVDWALACDTLPDRRSSAKDMALFHVAFTLPQTFVPAAMGILLDHFNRISPNSGYRVVFSCAVVFLVLGTVLVSRIRGVR